MKIMNLKKKRKELSILPAQTKIDLKITSIYNQLNTILLLIFSSKNLCFDRLNIDIPRWQKKNKALNLKKDIFYYLESLIRYKSFDEHELVCIDLNTKFKSYNIVLFELT